MSDDFRFASSTTSSAILLFDWLYTLPDEVREFWGQKPTGTGILFLGARYITLMQYVCFTVVQVIVWSNASVCTFIVGSLATNSFLYKYIQR